MREEKLSLAREYTMSLTPLFKKFARDCADALRGHKKVLRSAIERDDWEAAGKILQACKGAKDWEYKTPWAHEKPIHIAARNGAVQILTVLLHPQFACPVDERNSSNATPLTLAMLNGHEIAAKLLLAKGADIHVCGGHGSSPLMCAIAGGYQTLVELALDKGAVLNVTDPERGSPLMKAAYDPASIHILKFLLDKGADPNCRGGGIEALTQCLHHPNPAGFRMLLDRGAELDLADAEGCVTLLNWAVMANHPDIVKELLERGMDPLLPNDSGKTSVDVAQERSPAALKVIETHIARLETEARNRLIEAEVRQLNAGLPERITVKTLRLLKPAMP